MPLEPPDSYGYRVMEPAGILAALAEVGGDEGLQAALSEELRLLLACPQVRPPSASASLQPDLPLRGLPLHSLPLRGHCSKAHRGTSLQLLAQPGRRVCRRSQLQARVQGAPRRRQAAPTGSAA